MRRQNAPLPGTAPILEMARAYGLRPRLWLLFVVKRFSGSCIDDIKYCKAWIIVHIIQFGLQAMLYFVTADS